MKVILRSLFLLAGLALVSWYVWKAGPTEIYHNVVRLGWRMPLILVPYFLVYVLDTWGWHLAFGAYETVRPKYLSLFRVRWACEALNSLIPSGYLAGEAMKIYLLHKRGVDKITASTTVVVAKTGQVLAQVCFIGLGALAAIVQLPPENTARLGMVAIAVTAFGLFALLLLLQRRGMFSSLLEVVTRIPRFAKFREKAAGLRALDEQILDFYRRDRGRFIMVSAAFLLGWLFDPWEIYFVCRMLGLPLAWTHAVAIESFITVAKGLGAFIPAAMGVQESGVVLLFRIFALPAPIGLVYAILRRGRELFYVVVGGILLYTEEASFKGVIQHAAEDNEKSKTGLATETRRHGDRRESSI